MTVRSFAGSKKRLLFVVIGVKKLAAAAAAGGGGEFTDATSFQAFSLFLLSARVVNAKVLAAAVLLVFAKVDCDGVGAGG